jgi:hypothetical protein
MIEISFPNSSASEANILAQRLRLALLSNDVPDAQLAIAKERSETMDGGTMLLLAEYATLALHAVACAKAIWEICTSTRSHLRIRTPRGIFEIEPSEIAVDHLQKILSAFSTESRVLSGDH